MMGKKRRDFSTINTPKALIPSAASIAPPPPPFLSPLVERRLRGAPSSSSLLLGLRGGARLRRDSGGRRFAARGSLSLSLSPPGARDEVRAGDRRGGERAREGRHGEQHRRRPQVVRAPHYLHQDRYVPRRESAPPPPLRFG